MNPATAVDAPPPLPPGLVGEPPAAKDSESILVNIIAAGLLRPVFQPIFDFRTHRYHGYEGLIRGPAGTAYESPLALLELAASCGFQRRLDIACMESIMRGFSARQLGGTLFVNVSPNTLLDSEVRSLDAPRRLRQMGLDPSRVVLELIENQKVTDFDSLRDAVGDYRRHGIRVAIDDLGEGFSNLRLWSEVRPDYVKIDRHFVQGIGEDPIKFHLVNAIHELAEQSGATIIAEGIETERDFLTIRDLRIACAQGYFVARPTADGTREAGEHVTAALGKRQLFSPRGQPIGLRRTVAELCRPAITLRPTDTNAAAFSLFEADESILVIPIVDDTGVPCGLINRHEVVSRFARPYRRELYGRKACTMFMDRQPVIVDNSLTVQEVGRMMCQSDPRHMATGFVVTEGGRYRGIGATQDLMARITEMQLTAARYANPLTHLPGNVPIYEQIDRLIAQRCEFGVAYCDIDHFKPFNDQFGYKSGDEIIEMLGRAATEVSDSRFDFVGHIGGDDFIIVFQSPDWLDRCELLLATFDERVRCHFSEEIARVGGYFAKNRAGKDCFVMIPSLSIGALPVGIDQFESHGEIAAAVTQLKKIAKTKPGSAVFVERRCSTLRS